jgi:hypothetical protein
MHPVLVNEAVETETLQHNKTALTKKLNAVKFRDFFFWPNLGLGLPP